MRCHSPVLLLLLAVSCVSARPEVETVPSLPTSGAPVPPAPGPIPRSLVFLSDTSTHSYTSSLTTTLELTGTGDTVNDSIVFTADYTISASSLLPATRIRGSVNRVSVQAGSRIGTPPVDSLPFPFSFTGSIVGSLPQPDSVAGNPASPPLTCANSELAALAPLYQILTVLPATIPATGIWADSSTVPMCSGRIPVELTVLRTFRLLGESREEGRRTLLIERTARTRSTGNGSEGQHHVALATEGSGADTLRVDSQSGVLLASVGQYSSRVAVTSSGRTREFRQLVRQRTRKTP